MTSALATNPFVAQPALRRPANTGKTRKNTPPAPKKSRKPVRWGAETRVQRDKDEVEDDKREQDQQRPPSAAVRGDNEADRIDPSRRRFPLSDSQTNEIEHRSANSALHLHAHRSRMMRLLGHRNKAGDA